MRKAIKPRRRKAAKRAIATKRDERVWRDHSKTARPMSPTGHLRPIGAVDDESGLLPIADELLTLRRPSKWALERNIDRTDAIGYCYMLSIEGQVATCVH